MSRLIFSLIGELIRFKITVFNKKLIRSKFRLSDLIQVFCFVSDRISVELAEKSSVSQLKKNRQILLYEQAEFTH